jgi:DNA-directed RNA polymerase subunit RPC12/RpoP
MERMVKFYCDRCGKETEKLHEIRIPIKKSVCHTFDTKLYQVCVDCESEYDDIIDKLTAIRFVLFSGFMRKEDEGK